MKSAWPHTESADVSGKPETALWRYSRTRLFPESATKRSSPGSVASCCGNLSPLGPPLAVLVTKSGCPITSSAVTSPAPGSPLSALSGVLKVRMRLLPLSDTNKLSFPSNTRPCGEQLVMLLGGFGHPPATVKLVPVASTPKTLAAVVDAKPLRALYGYSSTRPLPESAI